MKLTRILLALPLIAPGLSHAFFGVQDDWQQAAAHRALPAVHIVVPARDLPRLCRTHPAASTYGCALRDFEVQVCIIYTAANPAKWLMEHERKHCEGWDHGPTPAHLAATKEDHAHTH